MIKDAVAIPAHMGLLKALLLHQCQRTMQDSSAALVSVSAKQGQAALLAMTQVVQVQSQHVALGIGCCTGDRAADHAALGIELRIMWFPMLTQN